MGLTAMAAYMYTPVDDVWLALGLFVTVVRVLLASGSRTPLGTEPCLRSGRHQLYIRSNLVRLPSIPDLVYGPSRGSPTSGPSPKAI